MRKMLKNEKKKGFTLIEMVAVVAIIGILAAILIPKITGYMTEAKKTAVINQARQVVQAGTGAIMKGETIDDSTEISALIVETSFPKFNSLFAGAERNKLPDNMKYSDCLAIVNDNQDFKLTGDVFSELIVNSAT